MPIDTKYEGNWQKVQTDCLLCEMEKKTDWYIETQDWVVAETLGGGPFVVSKTHQTELSDEEWSEMRRIVGFVFDDFDIQVRMNLVEEHWHGHIITSDDPDLEEK